MKGCSDGVTKQGMRYFQCPTGRGLFYSFEGLLPDDRDESSLTDNSPLEATSPESSFVANKRAPLDVNAEEHTVTDQQAKQEVFTKDTHYSGDSSDDIVALTEQVRQLSLQLEREKSLRVAIQSELAIEKRKNIEIRQEASLTSGCEMTPNFRCPKERTLFKLGWRIKRSDVMRTRTLGGGAWGLVYEGWYKHQAIAIKEPHLAIMSGETNKRMEREINIMASVQHPNLVRFIGAVMDADSDSLKLPPLLITELLDTDLRSAYNKHDLSSSRLPIFKDVAYALHYLHSYREPIIHRDVSAPNVLLQALPENMWRAKLSDFGSANIARYSKTAAEGAIIYSAPETFPSIDPTKPLAKQTTKIDVFSFGILLSEVITCKMPSPEGRLSIINELRNTWTLMFRLVNDCIQPIPEERLEMADILKALHTIPPNKKMSFGDY